MEQKQTILDESSKMSHVTAAIEDSNSRLPPSLRNPCVCLGAWHAPSILNASGVTPIYLVFTRENEVSSRAKIAPQEHFPLLQTIMATIYDRLKVCIEASCCCHQMGMLRLHCGLASGGWTVQPSTTA